MCKKIKMMVCGCGKRGRSLARTMGAIDEIEIIAVCDPYEDKAQLVSGEIHERQGSKPQVFTDNVVMFDNVKADAVLVSTTWETHVGVAIEAMKRHITVAMEVGGAYDIDECFELVKVYEETKTPFMFLENCCFGETELLATSLVRNGVLGEICYCSGAYRHDLTHEILSGDVNRHYRLRNYINRNCENYPTHEIGPIAKILNINRGNRMVSLSSFASKSRALHARTIEKEEYKHLRDIEFKQGDIVVTNITCENGELITLRLDTTLPAFYSRELSVRGTQGWYNEDNNMVFAYGEEAEKYISYQGTANFANYAAGYYKIYQPSLWRDITEETRQKGHGGMDYFELRKFADCILNNEEFPIDVYDAASWMAVTCLSETSIKNGGVPVDFPDFTNGKYKNRPIFDVVEIPKINK